MRPTIVFVGSVAIGLTLFEYSENVEMLYRNGQYVRMPAEAVRKGRPLLRHHEWSTRRDVPSGLLVLRAYSPYERARWAKAWRESKSGDLASLLSSICNELDSAAGTIAKLVEEGKLRAEEERRKREIQREVWRREEEERRKREEEAQRERQVREAIEQWRLARDIRACQEFCVRREVGDMKGTAHGNRSAER